VNQIGGQSTEALPDRGLGHVVLALGSYLLSAEASSKKCNTHDALLFFNAALNLKSDILQQSFSVQTFQVGCFCTTLVFSMVLAKRVPQYLVTMVRSS
jgi:hypothetical protein